MATPSTARIRRNIGHSRTTDDNSVSSAAASSEAAMSGLRDHPSATAPMTSIDTARQPVVTDSARLLAAALMWNSCVKIGSSGWTAYISRKTEKPAEKTARLIFQKAREPRPTWVRGFGGSLVRGFKESAPGEGETDAECHEDGAGHGFDAPLDAVGEENGGHALDKPRVHRQPDKSHDDMHECEEHGLRQDRSIWRDELREECDVEDGDLWIQQVCQEPLCEAYGAPNMRRGPLSERRGPF